MWKKIHPFQSDFSIQSELSYLKNTHFVEYKSDFNIEKDFLLQILHLTGYLGGIVSITGSLLSNS